MAALDPTDPRRFKAKNSLEIGDDKVVSELLIAELASVLARHGRALASIKSKLGVSEPIALIAIILYVLKRFNLKYVNTKGHSKTLMGSLYRPLAHAVGLAEKLKLRTLDLLHLAYIKAMKEQGLQISTLLTADADFKDHERDIQKILKINVDLIK